MSRPPTPVSACPLERLEVDDGAQARAYESAHFAGGLTLTLEGQRSMGTECDSLVLLIHCEIRRLLSIRVSDLLRDPSAITSAVSVDRGSRMLVIRVPAQRHEVRAAFADGRDFSLSVCMLKKAGFVIRDDTPPSASRSLLLSSRHQASFYQPGPSPGLRLTYTTSISPGLDAALGSEVPSMLQNAGFVIRDTPPPASRPFSSFYQPGPSPGPRLSSITPLPGLHAAPGSAASTVLPPNPFQTAQSSHLTGEPLHQSAYAPPLPNLPRPRLTPEKAVNPSPVYLSKLTGGLHRPQVSSPLRNSVSPDESVLPSQSPSTSTQSQSSEPRWKRPPAPESISTSGLPVQQNHRDPESPPEPGNRPRSDDGVRGDMPSEQDRRQPSRAAESFRDLMPQRRDLPFTREAVAKPAEPQDGASRQLLASPGNGDERGGNRHRPDDGVRGDMPSEQDRRQPSRAAESFRDLMPQRRDLPFTRGARTARQTLVAKPAEPQDGRSRQSPPGNGDERGTCQGTSSEIASAQRLRVEPDLSLSAFPHTRDRHGNVDSNDAHSPPEKSPPSPPPCRPDSMALRPMTADGAPPAVSEPIAAKQARDMISPSPDRHVCHCGKSFLRKEHLRRHQATHSEPAFRCMVCGRSFSRSDLLRRHAAIHGGAAAVPESRRGKACDTCHANRTRCDGGPPCSLCTKRGVPCTYSRRDGNLPPAKRARHSSAADAEAAVPEPVSPPATEPDVPSAGAAPGLCAVDVGGVISSSSSPPPASGQLDSTTKAALQSIRRLVASRSDTDSNAPPPPSAVPKSWLTACVGSYFGSFHDRWPILHAPGLDETTDSVALVASVVMISAWLHYDRGSKEVLMEIHQLLVEQSFRNLTNDSVDPSRPWPVKTYQVALLNIIFALECGRASCIKRCRHLLSLLVAALRQNGCFSSEALEREIATHYPGDFVPWVYSSTECWKRLVASTFQIDTYLSMLCNQPPLLRCEELDLGLTSTFAMWNAHGLHIFFPRHRGEPWARGTFKMSCLDMGTPGLLPSGILVEDIQACMLGSWNDIWLLQQLRRNRNDAGAALKAEAIARRLRLCKMQLDTVEDALRRPDLHGQYVDFLFQTYSGKELPSDPEWRERVLDRLYSALFAARMLYHLLSVHLHADTQAMKEVAQLSPLPGTDAGASAAPTWQRKAPQVQEWALSADSRAALVHAMFVWRTYQEAVPGQELRREPADSVAYIAVSAAAAVLWTWTVHAVHSCVCAPEVTKVDVGAGPLSGAAPSELDDWVLRGSGCVMLYGMTVCKCNAAAWLTRFAEALARGGERWELGSIAANTCLSKVTFS